MTVRELLEQMNAEGEAFDDAGQPEPDESPTMAHRFGSLFRGDRDQNQRDAEARDRREQRPRPPIRDVPPPRPGGRPGRHTSPPPPGGTPQGRNRPPVAPPGLDVTQRIPTIGDRDADVDLSEQATRRRAIAESRGQEPAPSDAPFDVIPPVAPARSGQDDTPTELIPVVGDDTAPETPVPPAADKTAEPADTEPVSVAALTADDETAAETPATEPEQPARSLIKGRARPLQRTPDLAAARTRVAAARGKAARRKALVRDATITGRILVAVACVLSLVGTGFVWGYIQSVNGNWRSIEALDSGDDNIRNKDAQHGDENYLIVGTDTRGGKNSTLGAGSADGVEGARSDTVILVSVPSDRDRVVAVSFPRDLQVDRPDCSSWDNDNGTYDAANVLPAAEAVKLNSVYAEGGPKCLVQVLTAMSGLNINHFIAMDFDGFEKVVRAIGGVEVCSTVPLYDYELGWILRKKGPKKLNGRYALNYVRARKIETEGNGDYGRIKRQQLFMSSLLRSTLSGNVLSNPGKLNGIVNTFINHSFVDGVDTKSLIKLAESMQGMDAGRVSFVTIPTSGTSTASSSVATGWGPRKPGASPGGTTTVAVDVSHASVDTTTAVSGDDVSAVLPSGGIILYNAYISLGEPSLTTNEIMAVGNGGVIVRYDGTSWKSVPSGTTNSLYGVYRRAEQYGVSLQTMRGAAFTALIAGFWASFVLEIAFYKPWVFEEEGIGALFSFSHGMSSYGGLIGAGLGLFIYHKIADRRWMVEADILIQGFVFGWIFGRLGCTFAHDHQGALSDFFLATRYPGGARHNLGFYEFLYTLFLLFPASWLLHRRYGRSPGLQGVAMAALRLKRDLVEPDALDLNPEAVVIKMCAINLLPDAPPLEETQYYFAMLADTIRRVIAASNRSSGVSAICAGSRAGARISDGDAGCQGPGARGVVAVWIALPVHAVLGRHVEAVALDDRSRVVGGPQADDLRPQQRRARIDVAAPVLDQDAHGGFIPPRAAAA